MKISTSTSCIFNMYGMEEGMKMFADAGFEAIDYGMFHLPWNGDMFVNASEQEFADYFRHVGKTAKDCGIEVYQCHSPFPLKVFDPAKDPGMLQCAVKSIYAAGYMDCPNIIIHPAMHPSFIYGRNIEECRRSNLEFYSAMVPALKETGVTMCVENMFAGDPETGKYIHTTCSKVEQMIDFIDTLNDMHGPYFAACLDTGHAMISGTGCTHMLKELGHRNRTLHIHDNNGLSDMHQGPGRGKINWKQFAEALGEVQYTGTFNFEADTFYAEYNKKDTYNKAVLQAACNMLYAIGRSLADIAEGKYQAE
ncbi:MAG: sugar phosphate isomerase/epimerase [Clostridia bacterium]|nr:sugar phosphate isomerase/epimerase [Clostridia bacterium]